jgi:ABC-type transport system involved in multi-copper enzyme maturation permease subunit
MLKRIPIIGIGIFIAVVAAVTVSVSGAAFETKYSPVDNTVKYNTLKTTILNWGTEAAQENIVDSFNEFRQKYRELNDSTYDSTETVNKYNAAKTDFNAFKTQYNNMGQIYWLIHKDHFVELDAMLGVLTTFFANTYSTADEVIDGLKINLQWSGGSILDILGNMYLQKLTNKQLAELNTITALPPSNEAYEVLYNTYAAYIDETFEGFLADYIGFENYNRFDADGKAALNRYIIDNNLQGKYSNAFSFGDVTNTAIGVSLFDYVFNNMEMATVPLILIVIILTACVFFTDIEQNTIIMTLSTRRRRTGVVLSKLLAVFVTTVAVTVCLSLIYIACGLVFYNAAVAEPIVCLFNGASPTVITQVNYFVIYILSLLFKLSVFIAGAGLFSLSKADPKIIVGATLLVAIAIILSNALLGGIVGIDIIKYFGATLFMSPTPKVSWMIYTLPVVAAAVAVAFWQLLHNFRKKDF